MSDRPPAEKEHAFSSENDQLYDQDDQRPDTHSTDTMDEDVGVHHSLHPYSDDVDSSNVQQSQAVDDDPHRDDQKYDDEEDDNLESSGEQHPISPQVGDVDDESRINDDDETRLLSSTAAAPSAAPATLAATSTLTIALRRSSRDTHPPLPLNLVSGGMICPLSRQEAIREFNKDNAHRGMVYNNTSYGNNACKQCGGAIGAHKMKDRPTIQVPMRQFYSVAASSHQSSTSNVPPVTHSYASIHAQQSKHKSLSKRIRQLKRSQLRTAAIARSNLDPSLTLSTLSLTPAAPAAPLMPTSHATPTPSPP